MTEHSQGPWRVEPDLSNIGLGGVMTADECQFWTDDGPEHAYMRIEDARLIAAAPELLAGLKAIIAGFDAGVWVRNISGDGEPAWAIKLMPHIQAMAAAIDAVAKAEGSEVRKAQDSSQS